MRYQEAIDGMQRHFFNYTTAPMEVFSLEDFPGSSVTKTGNVANNVSFTTAQLDPLGVKHVSYSFPVRFKSGTNTFSEQTVNLIGTGSGWNFNVQNAGSSQTLQAGLDLNTIYHKTDGYSLLSTIQFIKNHDLDDSNFTQYNGFGGLLVKHAAIPSEVMSALDMPSPSSDVRYSVKLIKRKGHERTHSHDGNSQSYGSRHLAELGRYDPNTGAEGTGQFNMGSNAGTDALYASNSYKPGGRNSYFSDNVDYRNSGLYIQEGTDQVSYKARENPSPTLGTWNSNGTISGYAPTPVSGYTPNWGRMSMINGGNFHFGSTFNTSFQGQDNSSPCAPIYIGLDFYGAPYDLSSSPCSIYGGNTPSEREPDLYGHWGNHEIGKDKGRVFCTIDIIPSQAESLYMPCDIKGMAAYEFSKQCFNGYNDNVVGVNNILRAHGRGQSFERYYYTIALVVETKNGTVNTKRGVQPKWVPSYIFPHSVRGVDKDDMPRLDNTGQINGEATNGLGQKHVVVFTTGLGTRQIYSNNIVQMSITDGVPSITSGGDNNGYTRGAVPTGAVMAHFKNDLHNQPGHNQGLAGRAQAINNMRVLASYGSDSYNSSKIEGYPLATWNQTVGYYSTNIPLTHPTGRGSLQTVCLQVGPGGRGLPNN